MAAGPSQQGDGGIGERVAVPLRDEDRDAPRVAGVAAVADHIALADQDPLLQPEFQQDRSGKTEAQRTPIQVLCCPVASSCASRKSSARSGSRKSASRGSALR